MKNNRTCSKKYPRRFNSETRTARDGYPEYRRRSVEEGGHTAKIVRKNGETMEMDNSWVVPYCPLLSKTFNAHINVEWCNSIKSIKYVCKYINKGSDSAMFALLKEATMDEIRQFECGRYINSNEGVWRFLK